MMIEDEDLESVGHINENNLDKTNHNTPVQIHEKFNFIVDGGQISMRIDRFLQSRITYATRSKIQRSIETKMVLVNNKRVKPNYLIKPNDKIVVYGIGEEYTDEIIPEDISIEVLYEDDSIIVVNKPAGMVVHPGCGNYKGTMLNAIAFYWQKNNYNIDSLPRLGLVHRIDKNTSGILVLGKTLDSIYGMVSQFSNHSIHRKYVALCWGDVKNDEGTIKTNIGRHERFRKKFDAYSYEGEKGKNAITHYKVIKRFNYTTLIECQLETGRTHQIRVHMKYIGHTLFNDSEYGGDKILKGTVYKNYQMFIDKCFIACQRHVLHAKELGFIHPITKEKLFFESPLPADIQALLKLWDDYGKQGKKII